MAAHLAGSARRRSERAFSAGAQHAGPDPLVERALNWLADAAHVEAIQHRWQHLESAIFDRSRELRLCASEVCAGDGADAKEMRRLSRQIDAGYHRLERIAGEISRMPAISPQGALSKIALGLNWQGPHDWWKPYAWELMEDGILELRALLANA